MLSTVNDRTADIQHLDANGTTGGVSFQSFGARIGIRLNDPELLLSLESHLPGEWESWSGKVDEVFSLVSSEGLGTRSREYLLYREHQLLASTDDVDDLLATLESWLHVAVALHADPWLFVHAGVVGWQQRAILIPGRSHSGKSTLVSALVQAGATYYSDEYAMIDSNGMVYPYPRPLTLRRGGVQRKERYPAETTGGSLATEPLSPGLIVVTSYKPETRWQPRALSSGQALLALLDNTVVARVRPRFALATLARALPGAIALKGRRGEAGLIAAPLLEAASAHRGTIKDVESVA